MGKGLYAKYTVINNEKQVLETDVFILKPETDIHARRAINTYIESVALNNRELAQELCDWMNRIVGGDAYSIPDAD